MVATQQQYVLLLRKFLAEHGAEYGIARMGIFGSVARGEQRAESDVDVLVEAPVLSLLSLVGIKRQLEEIFGMPVDVVRKTEYMPQRFKARVEKEVVYA
ncbi:MAG: nucleotidyltransferase family protein [Prevotellaceae bacterium]|jgi:predicted nucleotidyltransferase|nr:nucleotidyltransferase family protein [Prevotellaceae bacterium]